MSEPVNAKTVWNKHKTEIIIGVIVSVLSTIVIQVIISAPAIGKTLLDTFINYIFSVASFMDVFMLVLLLFVVLIAWSVSLMFIRSLERIGDKKKSKEKKNLKNSPEEELAKLDKELEMIEKSLARTRIALFITMLFFIIYLITCILIPAVLNKSFHSDIIMIKPYTDAQSIMILESNWARMKSKSDYDIIYQAINEVKEKNNIPKR